MKRTDPVINPTRWERYTLRFMVAIGVVCMIFFLKEIWSADAEYTMLFVLLMATIVFACLKILHEWIHYLYITVPDTPELKAEYTVDVFTTFCAGEPYDMITETLVAIKAIKYPHHTFLCDEADDPYLKKLCDELGVIHVTRTLKIDAKAGNINNALRYSSADLCVILDPDHVPFPEFLDPIVSHFNDPQVGFVQIVQSYKNQDQGLIAKGAAQQTYQFYGPIMMTMNRYGTVLAIGANCTFRRAALDSIGGHAAGLAEDMHTAMQLHAKGWKSVYVPSVLARGLVPSTLSAYYSQQLKWARGVFELLVTSYPKLFKKFSWRQKLHYGVIPMYYLSGLFILVNFAIPILSLVLNTSPINFDFLNFVTIGLPLFMSIMLIRLFVQKWVMEEEERGVHVVGGLLMIGTWWVFLVGLFYTILRKKVPYIPTPKDDNEDNNWRLNIPNLVVIVVSAAAIGYGLVNDWNPYNLIMAGFAAVNCLILSFTVAASQQFRFRRFKEGNWLLRPVMAVIAEFKKTFWKLRRQVYRGIRSTALMLAVLGVCYTVYRINTITTVESELLVESLLGRTELVPGFFSSPQVDGLTRMAQVREFSAQSGIPLGIVSYYIPWGDEIQCDLPVRLLDSVYRIGAMPMVTWEPWQSLFEQNAGKSENEKERKVFAAILAGDYDHYLQRFSRQVKSLNRPIFIRFAHESDNPQYPWSAVGENTAEEFKAAWQYVHRFFSTNDVHNAIWVWNPWKASAVDAYFPGESYVDWIGVTNLNYGSRNDDGQWYSMSDLYRPFRENSIFRSGIPVMLAEMGSLPDAGNQSIWFQQAFLDIERDFPEIKAVVFFDTNIDNNVPGENTAAFLDWTIADKERLGDAWRQIGRPDQWLTNRAFNVSSRALEQSMDTAKTLVSFRGIRGVNYAKGQNWTTNGRPLRKDEIVTDFTKMKEIGINMIKHYGPTVYDHSILSIGQEKKMDISYSFWIPDDIDFISDSQTADRFAAQVVKTVARLKGNTGIVMWNIGNSPLERLRAAYDKPDLSYQMEAYALWLSKLINDIKAVDPKRPVSVDMEMNTYFNEHADLIMRYTPTIDGIGLVAGKEYKADDVPQYMKTPYFYSKMAVSDFFSATDTTAGFFAANWQDEGTPGFVTLDGLIDERGISKFDRYVLANRWGLARLPAPLPKLKILRPAETINKGEIVTYRALIQDNGNWRLLRENDRFALEWRLIKINRYGDPLETARLGEGVEIAFAVPGNAMNYRLALYVSDDVQVSITQSNLYTPLYKSQWPKGAFSAFNLEDTGD